MSCLQLQAHAELPITLVLGMATSAGALQQMLPVAAASMLEPHHFQLMSSMERYAPSAHCRTYTYLVHSTAVTLSQFEDWECCLV